jgi:hypothetical protein
MPIAIRKPLPHALHSTFHTETKFEPPHIPTPPAHGMLQLALGEAVAGNVDSVVAQKHSFANSVPAEATV